MKKKIDRFVLVDALAEGGGGTVWQAEEILPGEIKRPVALKVLPALTSSDKAAQARFLEEIKLLVALGGQPHIVTVYGVGLADNVPWIAMEYLPQTLEQRIAEIPATPADVARTIEHVASGLAALHNLTPPLLHNDLKPANILVDAFGACKITDFSIASAASVERTRPVATVRYAAPELLSREFGKSCPATDLYALGHIAYEMALGGKLYRQQFPAVYEPRQSSKDANPAKWMAWHCSLNTRPAPIRDLLAEFPAHLSEIIARLMHKPLDGRYAAASEVLADLKRGEVASCGSTVFDPEAQTRREVAEVQFPVAGTTPAEPGTRSPAPDSSRAPRAQPPQIPTSAPSPRPAEAAAPAARPGQAPADNALYYIRFRGRVSGPVDAATLRRQIKQGLVSRLHQISNDRVTWRGIDTL